MKASKQPLKHKEAPGKRKTTGTSAKSQKKKIAQTPSRANKSKPKQLEKYLPAFMDQAHEMIMITDINGNIEYINPYFEKVTGYKKSEIIGKRPNFLESTRHDADLFTELRQTLCSGQSWKGIIINKKKNGEMYTEEANIFPIKDDSGKIIKIASIMRDISERKKAEEIILQKNKFFNNMIEAFTYPVYVIDVKSKKILVANSAARAQDITEGQLHSKIHYGSKLLSGKSTKESPLAIVKKTKEPVYMEYAITDNHENTVFRELYAYPVFDHHGKVVQVIEYIIDITDRKRSQEELVKLSQAVEQSLNIVMITDKNGTIEYVNPKFCEITGYTFNEVIGLNASTLGEIDPEDKKSFWKILTSEGEWRGEFHNRKKSGEYFWEYASIYAVKNSQNIVTHYIKDAVNTTKRKQAEEELRAAKEKAEQASKFKSEFLASMSHEIRTPLNSILGFIELLLTTELSRQQKDYFETIKDSSRVLLGIIEDILDFSKIESGRLEIDNNKFYLKHELEPVVDMFVARADEKNIDLLYFIDPSLPEYIYGDPLRIKQVLNNLISNAVKFTSERGKIFVEIKLQEMNKNECRISFSVSDNGIGIPENKQKMIFDAFFQADTSVSRNYGGTGLGLAISSHLVSLMGGELRLESKTGSGSKFYFDIIFTEFSGVDILKRDYNFEKLKCFLYSNGTDEKMQLYNIERYLKAFNIETSTFNSMDELKKSAVDSNNIIFAEYFINTRNEIKLIQQNFPDVPLILIANRFDKDFASLMINKITKVIYKPVYSSKIIGAIVEILYSEKPKLSSEHKDKKYVRPFFSADALVAEDNTINQKLIILMLKEIGIKADIAKNGIEAVDKFKLKPYDIILMDVNMPVMDGIETTKTILEIEKDNKQKHTPIIALTAKSIMGDREKIISSGMDDYISKPISMNKLCGTLYSYLKHKQVLSEKSNNITYNDAIIHEKKPASSAKNITYNLTETADELGVSIEFLYNLVEQFIKNFENYFSAILKCVDNLEYEVIYSEAHKLKGTASNLRLKKLTKYFSEMELNAKNKNNINYGELLTLIKDEFNSLKNNFLYDTRI